MTPPARIDTHQHIVPPSYAEWLSDLGVDAGGLPIPAWDPARAVEVMDEHGIATAIVSVSTPGVHLDPASLGADATARARARQVNEYAADVVAEHPGRFGFFATLTLPDVDGAIAEAAYALDELDADGVILLANVHGTYLGDERFDPLLAALDERAATIFVHPSELPGPGVPGVPPFAADFLLDTTRAAVKLAMSGAMDRYRRLRIILGHAGGFLPYAAHRLAPFCGPEPTFESGLGVLRRFWFDTALSASPTALPSLLAFADPTRILFGSDWPYAPVQAVSYFCDGLDRYDLDAERRAAVNRGNAEALFPRLARR